ncbi:MAG: alpha/beta fold hydrolase [Patescibacteria group bacterium]|nr:alpha/beta fold hydrolase [Patescibacteria group bacterium]
MKSFFSSKKTIVFLLVIILAFLVIILSFVPIKPFSKNEILKNTTKTESQEEKNPLSIEYMRQQEYPGSNIFIEETLPVGLDYNRYIASYKSDGLKIYGLLTVPIGEKPKNGWPVVIFNHGYIPPAEYRTTERYIAYTDVFSRNGYIVFKPDYRGHGDSEGNPEGAYYSPAYTRDVLNAVSSIKKYRDADPNKIGMWGHSMGGSITLRSMVVTKDIKVGVIWGGVVASYEDMAKNWSRSRPWVPSQREQVTRRPGRQALIAKYGDFDKNPEFWQSITPISYVKDISGPVQIHHGTQDEEVPLLFSERLNDALKNVKKEVEFYSYPGDDHNISNNLYTALQRSLEFFDKYLKN